VSALHKAAWLGCVDSIELLCQKGAEVDIKSKSYAATPLSKVRLFIILIISIIIVNIYLFIFKYILYLLKF
jgi:hypothetical protein